jgi:hypothetical protein
MASAGRSFVDKHRGTHDFMSYVGLQFTWGGNEKDEAAESQSNESAADADKQASR